MVRLRVGFRSCLKVKRRAQSNGLFPICGASFVYELVLYIIQVWSFICLTKPGLYKKLGVSFYRDAGGRTGLKVEGQERSGAYILNFETFEMRCFLASGWDLLYIF